MLAYQQLAHHPRPSLRFPRKALRVPMCEGERRARPTHTPCRRRLCYLSHHHHHHHPPAPSVYRTRRLAPPFIKKGTSQAGHASGRGEAAGRHSHSADTNTHHRGLGCSSDSVASPPLLPPPAPRPVPSRPVPSSPTPPLPACVLCPIGTHAHTYTQPHRHSHPLQESHWSSLPSSLCISCNL